VPGILDPASRICSHNFFIFSKSVGKPRQIMGNPLKHWKLRPVEPAGLNRISPNLTEYRRMLPKLTTRFGAVRGHVRALTRRHPSASPASDRHSQSRATRIANLASQILFSFCGADHRLFNF
jgi:hypothetical protein